jgi:accessory gene regulator B
MEKLTNNISGKIAAELNLDNDNKEVIAYGIFALMDISIAIILIIIFGIIFGVAIEALIVCFAGSILRKYSGGVHATSPGRCTLIGTIICIGQAILFLFLISPVITPRVIIFLGIGVFTLAYYLIFKLAPVDSPAKPIRTKKKKIRMKKGSIFVLSGYMLIVAINTYIYIFLGNEKFMVYSLCIYGGVVWQIFTLTALGHSTMNKIDTFLSEILKIKKGGE